MCAQNIYSSGEIWGDITVKLNREQLKLIAIISMVIDHIAWAFVDFYSPLGQFMHVCGRLAIPIMCYFVAEGYRNTKDIKRYIDRMITFGVLSIIPFYLFFHDEYGYRQNIIFDLLGGLLAITLLDRAKKKWQKVVGMVAIFGVSMLVGGWPIAPILFIIIFYFGKTFKQQVKWFAIVNVLVVAFLAVAIALNSVYHFSHYDWVWWDKFYLLGFMLAFPLLHCYNGEKGKVAVNRYFFYFFYPLHFLFLVGIKWLIGAEVSAFKIDLYGHIIALIICCIVIVFASCCRPSRGQIAIIIFLISSSVYVFGFIMEIVSSSVSMFHIAIMVQYFGEVMCFVGLTYFLSALCKIKIPFAVYAVQGVIGILILFGLFTTRRNRFFYKQIRVDLTGAFPRPVLIYGPGFYLTLVYIACLSAFAIGICIYTYVVGNRLDRKRVIYTIIAIFCVWIPYPIKLSGLTGGYEIPGLGIAACGILLYFVLVKYGFLDTVTLAGENVLDHGNEGILVIGTDYHILYHNKKIDELFGDVPHDIDLRAHELLGVILAGKTKALTLNERVYEFVLEPLKDSGVEQGKMLWIHDATEHYESMERVREIATKDPLTKLYNRIHYQDLIEKYLRWNDRGTFVMIDMDDFKKVNDQYGHQVGDDVLNLFADILKGYTEQQILACRMGGDEFSFFIKNETDEKVLGPMIQKMMEDYQKLLSSHGYEKYTSLSAGAITVDERNYGKVSFAAMYKVADRVLYEVKQRGKNQYIIQNLEFH